MAFILRLDLRVSETCFMAIRSWQAVLTTVAISFGSMPSTLATELEARSIYNNKMTLVGVLREGARQRAVDVTDRYLDQAADAGGLRQRRQRMQADLNTCQQGMKSSH